MKFGYTIIYVPDVVAAIEFYGRAFGLTAKFVHDSGQYGELETGETTLAFASEALASGNLPAGYLRPDPTALPFGIEVGFITDDVPSAVARAVAAGAALVSEPKTKPWGQIVAYVRAIEGTLVELCTPVGG